MFVFTSECMRTTFIHLQLNLLLNLTAILTACYADIVMGIFRYDCYYAENFYSPCLPKLLSSYFLSKIFPFINCTVPSQLKTRPWKKPVFLVAVVTSSVSTDAVLIVYYCQCKFNYRYYSYYTAVHIFLRKRFCLKNLSLVQAGQYEKKIKTIF